MENLERERLRREEKELQLRKEIVYLKGVRDQLQIDKRNLKKRISYLENNIGKKKWYKFW